MNLKKNFFNLISFFNKLKNGSGSLFLFSFSFCIFNLEFNCFNYELFAYDIDWKSLSTYDIIEYRLGDRILMDLTRNPIIDAKLLEHFYITCDKVILIHPDYINFWLDWKSINYEVIPANVSDMFGLNVVSYPFERSPFPHILDLIPDYNGNLYSLTTINDLNLVSSKLSELTLNSDSTVPLEQKYIEIEDNSNSINKFRIGFGLVFVIELIYIFSNSISIEPIISVLA